MARIRACFLVFVIAGCTASQSHRDLQVEIISPLQQSEDAIRATPTHFSVSYGDDRVFWTRAQLFLNSHTDGFATKQGGHTDNSWALITNRSVGKPKYVYEVSRRPGTTGVDYSVRCLPGAPGARGDRASLNAQNLARFIKDGTLEVALLDP